jgi:transposase
MAEQSGLGGELPAQSLIGLTHHLANFLEPIYKKIKAEVLASKVLLADETPHRMLEGDDTKNWYLWGFFSSTACYFETHNTRSGDVALNFLTDSKATILLTDAYAGYGKAIKEIAKLGRQILEAHCNAHAFRYFKEASITWESECEIFLKLYGQVYDLERERKEVNESLEFRARMLPYFEEIKLLCEQRCDSAMPGSQLHKAMNYFLNHYKGLTLCLEYLEIPLDNNESERELRSPVVGRKTWLGTHSKRGALTSAVLFSVVQSCKINGVNPKNYFPSVVKLLHQRKEAMTPYEYSLTLESEQGTL